MKKIVKVSGTILLSLALSSCSWPLWISGTDDSGSSLAAGNDVNMHFFTNIPNFDTGVRLLEGGEYAIDIRILSNWVDSTIAKNEDGNAVDERGFADSEMSHDWVSWTKRSRNNRWFELMLFQANCPKQSRQGITELNIDEASGSYNFVAACDGKLTLFVNDSHGFYSNNVGYANIALARVN